VDNDADDPVWEHVVTCILKVSPAEERRSRYGDKPALSVNGREIAHREGPGLVDLRITRHGWSQIAEAHHADPVVRRDASRRDWIELRLGSPAEVERLQPLLRAAVGANTR